MFLTSVSALFNSINENDGHRRTAIEGTPVYEHHPLKFKTFSIFKRRAIL